MARVVRSTAAVASGGVGNPDYAAPAPLGWKPSGVVYTLTDIGEMAARLGYPSLDRRGNVVLFEDWSKGVGASGGSWNVVEGYLEPTRYVHFPNSSMARMHSVGTTDAEVIHRLPYLSGSKIGLEIVMAGLVTGDCYDFSFGFDIYTGTRHVTAKIKFDANAAKWYYYTTTGWVELTTLTTVISASDLLFSFLKLVFDPVSTEEMYTRLVYNGTQVDLSSYALYGVADLATAPEMDLTIHSTHFADDHAFGLYLGPVIVTQNEPEN